MENFAKPVWIPEERDIARFWATAKEQGACLEWPYPGPDGYGTFQFWLLGKKRTVRTHRLAYALTFGDPGELHVLHRCDYKPCIQPTHLFAGTRADNMRDMVSKERNKPMPGILNPASKLTEEHVREILRLKGQMTQEQIGLLFDVHQTLVSMIHRGVNWKHLR